MLVLSRKPQQEILLSNGVTFKVLTIQRGTVRVGIAAPEGVRVVRAEAARPEQQFGRTMK